MILYGEHLTLNHANCILLSVIPYIDPYWRAFHLVQQGIKYNLIRTTSTLD